MADLEDFIEWICSGKSKISDYNESDLIELLTQLIGQLCHTHNEPHINSYHKLADSWAGKMNLLLEKNLAADDATKKFMIHFVNEHEQGKNEAAIVQKQQIDNLKLRKENEKLKKIVIKLLLTE